MDKVFLVEWSTFYFDYSAYQPNVPVEQKARIVCADKKSAESYKGRLYQAAGFLSTSIHVDVSEVDIYELGRSDEDRHTDNTN